MFERNTRLMVGLTLLSLLTNLGSIRAQGLESHSTWLVDELETLDQAKQAGAQYAIITFSAHRLYRQSENINSFNETSVQDYQSLLDTAERLGLTPIGTATTWVFPAFSNAPLIPADENPLFDLIPEARINCIPELEGGEYARFAEVRNQMWNALAQEFTSVRFWFVGYEPGFEFFSCSGEQLELEVLFEYVVDTLRDLNAAIKSNIPDATVVAHFLGRTGVPIHVRHQMVQPQTILDHIAQEIDRRGEPNSEYYDMLAVFLEPSLLFERFSDETSVQPSIGSSAVLPPVLPKAYRDVLFAGTPGWNTKWQDEFTSSTSNLVSLSNWDSISHDPDDVFETTTQVTGGQALLRLSAPPGSQTRSFAGAKTAASVDIVPDQEFDSQGTYPGAERNRWTALADSFPVENPDSASSHLGAFLRVQDRDWSPPTGIDEQTRFGTIAYRGPITQSPCTSQWGCGALQLSGDDLSANPPESAPKGKLLYFTLSKKPWSYPSVLFRIQIIEREWFHPLSYVWEPWWMAEVHDLTYPGTRIGYRDWIGEWTIENIYGIAVPGLSGSKFAFALSENFDGGANTERTGTAYWIY
jgi:hypothetical protein